MENISLAAKYRPQNFATMLGQDTIKKVLSEAAFQNKVAPAYLLSGTRGVGKTTIARIFAKALNCETRDTRTNGEPCNECSSCKRITHGAYVDVLEMDGASHTSVDDARRINEMVQYAPLEGRYKVIIIDEAHMLSKNAFNALLKTLEEPPSYTVFIFASTELHKFPITIISRCQHFVCRSIPENDLRKHLKYVLESEGKAYDEEAIKIIAKRGAGSVRDSMSLLDQSLALAGGEALSEQLTRLVLGLGSKDIITNLLCAVAQNNPLEVVKSVQNMTLQGLDIAYFLRELAQLWRSFFLLKKYGNKALELLELTSDDAQELLEMSKPFTEAFVHSAWQMTLEAQRKVTTSLEPAVALELFLINLSILPDLLPVNELRIDADCEHSSNPSQRELEEKKKLISQVLEEKIIVEEPVQVAETKVETVLDSSKLETAENKINNEVDNHLVNSSSEEKIEQVAQVCDIPETVASSNIEIKSLETNVTLESSDTISADMAIQQEKTLPIIEENSQEFSFTYRSFLDYLKENSHQDLYYMLQHINGEFVAESENPNKYKLSIQATSDSNMNQITRTLKMIETLLTQWSEFEISLDVRASTTKSPAKLREELEAMPIVQEIQSLFNAHITFCEAEKN